MERYENKVAIDWRYVSKRFIFSRKRSLPLGLSERYSGCWIMRKLRWLLSPEGVTTFDKIILFISKSEYALFRLISIFLHNVKHYSYTKSLPRAVIVRMKYGLKAKVHDWYQLFMFTGEYEPVVSNFMKLEEHSNFIDVGANVGFYTLLAASKSSKGKVISIEADNNLFDCLVENVRLNGLTNVECVHCAVWDTDNLTVKLFKDETIQNFTCFGLGDKYSLVNTKTLDSIILVHKLSRIDWLKIDVEGAEVKVLLGARKTLEITKNVLIEMHSSVNGEQCKKILASFGFNLEVIKHPWIHAKRVETGIDSNHPHVVNNGLSR